MKLKKVACFMLFSAYCFLFISGCSKKGAYLNLPKPKDVIIYPMPPDTARIQYLCSFSNSKNISGSVSAFKKFILGEGSSLPILKPYGISVKNGKIYICDDGAKAIEIVDMDKNSFNYFRPRGKGAFKSPINCFVDNNDFLYVADPGRQQIVIFDNKREYINAIGGSETFRPTDVFVKDNKIFVADSKNNRINVYNNPIRTMTTTNTNPKSDTAKTKTITDKDYTLLYSFPQSEQGKEDFLYSPLNVYVTEDKVYVDDFGDFKIKIYTLDGKYLGSVGSYGKNLGQFARPKGVAVDKDGNLYVVDAAFENTQIFNKEGKLLLFFGGPYSGPGDMWLPAKVTIDYNDLKYFQNYVDKSFDLKYLIFVTNQYGPDKISIYGAVKLKKK